MSVSPRGGAPESVGRVARPRGASAFGGAAGEGAKGRGKARGRGKEEEKTMDKQIFIELPLCSGGFKEA